MLFLYLASLLASFLLSNFAPPLQNPTEECFQSAKTLVGLVDCLEDYTVLQGYYDQYSYLEAQPTIIQRKAWFNAVFTLLHTDNNCTSAIVPSAIRDVYSAAEFTDSDGQSFCVLYERTVCPCSRFVKKGWGFMVVPSSRDAVLRHIHLSGPHPFFDGETSEQATHLFKGTGAKSLLIPGRLRTAYPAPSACIMGPRKSPYFMTDPAHNNLEPFFDANVAIWEWQSQHGGCPSASCAFIQLHGKADTTCAKDTIFLSTGLGSVHRNWYTDSVDRPIKRLKEQLLVAFSSDSSSMSPVTVSLPSDSKCPLTATKNVVGRYLNNIPAFTTHDVFTNAMASQGVQKPSLRLRTSKPNLDPNSSAFSSRRPFDSSSSSTTTQSTAQNMTAATLAPLLPTTTSTITPALASPISVKSTHTDTGSVSTVESNHANSAGAIAIHRGAIDNTTITQRPPNEVMNKVREVLDSIGICVQPESTFRLRCIRPSQSRSGTETPQEENELMSLEALTNTIYSSDPSRDPAGEVRFSVELTRLAGLNDTYSLDIRRLKGNLRSYQFLYETIRDRAQLAA
ncbi:hypothetical protein NP233_g6804 [Leucocoprinus birnbaumii]|uniref:non-specific serine/threonine protein kinase n=1 Tax=Leucocoprinus birnbaumii TaxID=56174 RepID=A0AAD5VQC7_9AGAR|nr:hypothetical protein NP233_g6804 [Leucocoprinus birnbaumii]